MAQESDRVSLAQNRAEQARLKSLETNEAGDNVEIPGDSDQDWKNKGTRASEDMQVEET